MTAFRAALEAGADGVELDVHLSADGVPVVMHNALVDATTDGTGSICDLTLAEIKQLDAGSHKGPQFAGERVPTLEEVLTTFGDRLLTNIELKPQSKPNIPLVATVADLVDRLGLAERVWVSSFKPYSLFQMRQVAPAVPCGLLYSPMSLGTLWVAPLTPFEAVHPHLTMVPDWFVRMMHLIGRRVVVWTVDEIARARSLAAAGVDGIITNDPGAVLEGLWSSADQGAREDPREARHEPSGSW